MRSLDQRRNARRRASRLPRRLPITLPRELIADPRVCRRRVDAARSADLVREQLACLQVKLPLGQRQSARLFPRSRTLVTAAGVANHLCKAGGLTARHLASRGLQAPLPVLLADRVNSAQSPANARDFNLGRYWPHTFDGPLDRQSHRETALRELEHDGLRLPNRNATDAMTCVDDEIVHRQSQLSESVHCSSFDMTARPKETSRTPRAACS